MVDLSQDYLMIDGNAPVTLTKSVTQNQIVPDALRREITLKEMASSGGVYQAGDVSFSLPNDLCTIYKPAVGDTITDYQDIWTILTVAYATMGTRWRCVCRRVGIGARAVEIMLSRATWAVNTDGSQSASWSAIAILKSKISITQEITEEADGRRKQDAKATMYVTPTDIMPGDMVELMDPTGAGSSLQGQFFVMSITGKAELAALWTIELSDVQTPLEI